jgi:hypothetical protein
VFSSKVKASPTFKTISQTGDAFTPLKLIQSIAYNHQAQYYVPQGLHDALRRFYNCHQLRNQTTQGYCKYFQNQVSVVHHVGGLIGDEHPAMLDRVAKELNKNIEELDKTDKQIAQKNS